MWKQKIKKVISILIILTLSPFILTVFFRGVDTDHEDEKLDMYGIGVLAKEVSQEYEDEMIKAQALLVRTTIYNEIQENKGVLDIEEECRAARELKKEWYDRLRKIWSETQGQVLMYEDTLALVPFHYLSNGKTRSGKEALGSEEYPYLQSVECSYDVESDRQISSKVIPIKEAKIISVDSSGYVTEIQVGEEKVSGEHFRETYELESSCFVLQDAGDKLRVTASGVGHGLGMSQYTANEMAKNGNTYREILSYFFPKTEIKEVAEVLINEE